MELYLMYGLVACASVFIFAATFLFSYYFAIQPRHKLFVSKNVWKLWVKTVEKEKMEPWNHLLRRAGQPLGWGKAEWIFAQWICGLGSMLVILVWSLFRGNQSFPLITFCLAPSISFFLPYFVLRFIASQREEILSLDIARFINRYINLLENHVPVYNAMVKAARPTRQLKHYVPSLSEWNRDRFHALEVFKRQLGIDDAIILVSSMRTIEQLSTSQMAVTMQRLEWAVDNKRMFRHRKKIKSLGVGYSVIVYPAFYIGLIVALFPWYKLLVEILDKYLV